MMQENKKYYLLCDLFDTDLINIINYPGPSLLAAISVTALPNLERLDFGISRSEMKQVLSYT